MNLDRLFVVLELAYIKMNDEWVNIYKENFNDTFLLNKTENINTSIIVLNQPLTFSFLLIINNFEINV